MASSSPKRLPVLLTVLVGSLLLLALTLRRPVEPTVSTLAPPPSTIRKTTLDLRLAKGMEDTGKLRRLAAALRQHPKHDEVTLRWFVPQSPDSGLDELLIYNRRTGTLRYESWLSNFCDGETFDNVTDAAIHTAGKDKPILKQPPVRLPQDVHWIRALLQRRCHLVTSFQN